MRSSGLSEPRAQPPKKQGERAQCQWMTVYIYIQIHTRITRRRARADAHEREIAVLGAAAVFLLFFLLPPSLSLSAFVCSPLFPFLPFLPLFSSAPSSSSSSPCAAEPSRLFTRRKRGRERGTTTRLFLPVARSLCKKEMSSFSGARAAASFLSFFPRRARKRALFSLPPYILSFCVCVIHAKFAIRRIRSRRCRRMR